MVRLSAPKKNLVNSDSAPPTAAGEAGLRGARTAQRGRDDELELARAWRERGDVRARNQLVEAHLSSVTSVARKYVSARAPLSELVAAGRLGLLRACDGFEPDRGLRFITYANFWIRAEILSFTWLNRSLVSASRTRLQRRLHPLRHERARALQDTGDLDQVDGQLAARAGVSVDTLRQQLGEWSRSDVALDSPLRAGSSISRLDALESDAPNAEALMLHREAELARVQGVSAALLVLDRRERLIVEARLMASDGEEASLRELGAQLGVSRERVRQIELRAKAKLARQLLSVPRQAELLSA